MAKQSYYKLYEIPNNTRILVEGSEFDWVLFHHLDGLYSFCTTPDGKVCHLGANSPLVKVGLLDDGFMYYRLVQNEEEVKKAATYFKGGQ